MDCMQSASFQSRRSYDCLSSQTQVQKSDMSEKSLRLVQSMVLLFVRIVRLTLVAS